MAVTLKINKSSFILKFGMSCLFSLGKKWNLKSLSDVLQRFVVLENIDENNILLDQIEVICDIVECAIASNPENELSEKDKAEIINVVFNDIEKLAEIMKAFVESMPQANKGKKPIPAKKKK
jgi:hypothetical protein